MCLFCQNYWVHKSASGKHRLACKGGLACRYSWKNLGHNLESSFSCFLYNHAGIMSIQKWHQLAEEKSAVDQQTQDIHQKFRMDKISKEFGQLSGEELFKPPLRKRWRKVPIMQWMNLTEPTCLVMNSDRMPQHQPHHHHHHHHQNQHHHPHMMMMMVMIFHHHPHR